MQDLVIGIVAAGLVFWLFCSMERRGSAGTVGIVLGVVVAEAFLFDDQGTSSGIFYLSAGGENLRLPQVLIPIALVAAWFVRGRVGRVTPAGALWGAFFTWYATCLVVGLLNGNDGTNALFAAKTIIYVGGGYLLASRVAASRLVKARTVAWWMVPIGLLALATFPTAVADTPWGVSGGPLFDTSTLGSYAGGELTTILTALGTVALIVELCRPKPRLIVALACVAAMLTPLGGSQRASLVALAVALVCIVVLVSGRTWSQRSRVRRSGVVLSALLLVGLGVGAIAIAVGQGATNPVAERVFDFSGNKQKVASAKAREGLFSQAVSLIEQEPIVGWGLGKQVRLEHQPFNAPDLDVSSHNLILDLWIRGGVVAVLLFLAALIASIRQGIRVWRRSTDRLVAALAIGATIGVVAIMAKAMLEPVFEQFKVVTVFGLLLGVISAAARAQARPAPASEFAIAGIGPPRAVLVR